MAVDPLIVVFPGEWLCKPLLLRPLTALKFTPLMRSPEVTLTVSSNSHQMLHLQRKKVVVAVVVVVMVAAAVGRDMCGLCRVQRPPC